MRKKMSFDSRIIEHMGKDLITSPEVAVIELVKNSIDAKSKIVNFKIYSSLEKENLSKTLADNFDAFNEYANLFGKSCILVEDYGIGMSETTLEKGFLNVGTQIKLQESEPLFGQKGIGRLAAQRLGKVLIVETTQKNDNLINVLIIDWNRIVSSDIENITVPFYTFPKENTNDSYTRLWILDAAIDDIVERPQQYSFLDKEFVELQEDVASAIAFLVSPYETNIDIKINVFYDNKSLQSNFDRKFLKIAESVHSFKLSKNEEGKLKLDMSMNLSPFYIAKTHRTRLGTDVDFSLHKLNSKSYSKLYKKYQKRYMDTLKIEMDEHQLVEYFEDKLRKIYRSKVTKDKKEKFQEYIHEMAIKQIDNLAKIAEISGEIYSFKRDNAVGGLYLDFVKEENEEFENITIRNVQSFLKHFNGVKLYRNAYRIGFLGNRDNDWIEMQQYRTMGQQFYRFNLGDTLGYVKINDIGQNYIKEISSRLDIYTDDVSRTFKDFINYIFNEFFYKFNRSADDITRSILLEENLIEKNIQEKVKKASDETKELLLKNKNLLEKINKTKSLLNQNVVLGQETATLPSNIYKDTIKFLSDVETSSKETNAVIMENQKILSQSSEKFRQIEIEAFNNFKLMANGLITESITHELHSLVTEDGIAGMSANWDLVGNYLILNAVSMYNNNFIPMKESYETVVAKIDDVSDLYKLLEGTFLKGNSKSDYTVENLSDTIAKIEETLIRDLKKNKITMQYETMNMTQILPKGVMLHVFYNLITNSKYWIDYRRKHAKFDKKYASNKEDYIRIECKELGIIEVSDSGTGVLKNMEHVLFGALQSGKEANKGRGMGLYIVKRFLNSFDADIILSDERNEYGNRYKFIISLPLQ